MKNIVGINDNGEYFFEQDDVNLNIEYLDNYNKDWDELAYKHSYDSGIDLKASIPDTILMEPFYLNNTVYKISFGIKIELDNPKYDAKIYNRSGTSCKYGIKLRNSVGVIDNHYRGEVMGVFKNESHSSFAVNPGDRLAQLIVEKRPNVSINTVEKVNTTERGNGGFGSTGVK